MVRAECPPRTKRHTLGEVIGNAAQRMHNRSKDGPRMACLAARRGAGSALCLPQVVLSMLRAQCAQLTLVAVRRPTGSKFNVQCKVLPSL